MTLSFTECFDEDDDGDDDDDDDDDDDGGDDDDDDDDDVTILANHVFVCLICFALSVDCVSISQTAFLMVHFQMKKRTAWSRMIHSKVYTQVFEMNPQAGGLHIPKYVSIIYYTIYHYKPVLICSEFCWYILWNITCQVDVFKT